MGFDVAMSLQDTEAQILRILWAVLIQIDGVLFSADAIPLDGAMPIYDDVLASVRSIKRLKAIEGIKVLLSAWDEPKFGDDAYRIMNHGLEYLQQIHGAVIKSAEVGSSQDPMELCRRTIGSLVYLR